MNQSKIPSFRRSGFTLIELSIVLVIIGLVIGVVMVGKNLIRSSQLQRLLSDKNAYETAFNAFRLKYNCIAGDCPNATDLFGASTDCADAHCKNLTKSGGTCNGGNGNGIIDNIVDPTTATPYPYIEEDLLLWNQLSLADFVSGGTSGRYWGTYCGYSGANAPLSTLNNNSVWWANANTVVSGRMVFTIGFNTGEAWGSSINAADAYSLDSKIDDGNPNAGNFRGREGYKRDLSGFFANGCRVGNTYDVNQAEERCLISFLIKQ